MSGDVWALFFLKGVLFAMAVVQVWKSTKFAIERHDGNASGTVVFRLEGPFTARDMYGSLSPDALKNTFASEAGSVHVLDLTAVPYVDSSGLGMMVSHYVRCQGKGIRLVVAGASSRVVELLEMTKTDPLFPRFASVEEAERG
jgi:anti-anti-sigma factor